MQGVVNGKIKLSITSKSNDGELDIIGGDIATTNLDVVSDYSSSLINTELSSVYQFNPYKHSLTLQSELDTQTQENSDYYLSQYAISKTVDFTAANYKIELAGKLIKKEDDEALFEYVVSMPQPLTGHNWNYPTEGEVEILASDGSTLVLGTNYVQNNDKMNSVHTPASPDEETNTITFAWNRFNNATMFFESVNNNVHFQNDFTDKYKLVEFSESRFPYSTSSLIYRNCHYCIADVNANDSFYIYLSRVPASGSISVGFRKGKVDEGCQEAEPVAAAIELSGAVVKVTPTGMEPDAEYCSEVNSNLKNEVDVHIGINFWANLKTLP